MADVLHIITDTDIGGAGRYLLTLLESCDRVAFPARVVCPAGGSLAVELARIGIPVLPLPEGDRSLSARSLSYLVTLLRRERPAIVHTHASLSGRIAARLAGVPVLVMTRHTIGSGEPSGAARRAINRLVAGMFTDAIIAVSGATAATLAAEGVPASLVRVIYNGYSAVAAGTTGGNAQTISRELGLNGSPVIGVVARLSPEKGHAVLLRALPAVRARFPGLNCLFVGAGVAEQALRDTARSLGLENAVRFAGYRADVERVIPLFDLAVLPSHSEALGLALLEAMANGKPVVATRVGGIPEVVADGRSGLLVPPDDPAALASAIIRVLGEPGLAREMGEAGRAIVGERFLATRMATEVQNLYSELLRRKTRS